MNILKIQFQTADILPPPFAKAIEIIFYIKNEKLNLKYNLEYLNREQITLDEIESEGFTENDNLTWDGELPIIWEKELEFMMSKTIDSGKKLIEEDEDFYLIEMKSKSFAPKNEEQISYFIEEISQSILENLKIEMPLKITFLKNLKNYKSSIEVNCSFFERVFDINYDKNGVLSQIQLPWHQGKPILVEIFNCELNEDGADLKKPIRDGVFINFGEELWFQKEKTWLIERPTRFLKEL